MQASHLGQLLLSVGAAALNTTAEQTVSVVLWDSNGKDAARSGHPPRYVIGQAVIGGRTQHFTFDAGNAKEPILLAEGCVGCSTGCPSSVPQCSSSSNACWSSRPGDYAPRSSYELSGEGCPSGVKSAGHLNGDPVCTQCFGGSSHSRFYTMAKADVTIDGIQIRQLNFGALVRTAPAIDRVWSNIGIGYQSHFMSQLGASSVLLHLRVGEQSSVIFNPATSYYHGAQSARFSVSSNREHSMDRMVVGGSTVDFKSATFHIDTGNSGISIIDSSLLKKLNSLASHLSPSTAPELEIVLDGMHVTLPGNVWVTSQGRTCFSQYHKNVLGLPFITSTDIIFNDSERKIYVSSAAPSPSPSPSPVPSPTPSSCVDECSGQCDCECFCSCGAVCGGGCYGQCKSVHHSCSGNCPESMMGNSSSVVV